LKPIINPKREKNENIGIGNANVCNIEKTIPVAKDKRIDIINLLVFFKKKLLTIPRKMVTPKKIPFKIK
jgi:hypothetical protein